MSPEPPGLRAQASPVKGKGGSGDESAPSLVSRFGQNAAFASLGALVVSPLGHKPLHIK